MSLFENIGGKEVLQKVHKTFYDKLYKHPWLKDFFLGTEQELIENQQTDFITKAMGGPNKYIGRDPIQAHKPMFITEEQFEIRHALLKESIKENSVSEENMNAWLKIDYAFKFAICKKSINDCERKFASEEIKVVPKPSGWDKKAA